MSNTARFRTTLPVVALTIVLALTVTGCSGGTGEVSGTVGFSGKKFTAGRVTFVSAGNPAAVAHSLILSDGTYKVENCPCGPVARCNPCLRAWGWTGLHRLLHQHAAALDLLAERIAQQAAW